MLPSTETAVASRKAENFLKTLDSLFQSVICGNILDRLYISCPVRLKAIVLTLIVRALLLELIFSA